jgi:hypothetical protein
MRGDWLYMDFVRNFLPNWLSKATSLKVVSAATLALIGLVVVLKVVA